jgi:hypothetical protein
MRSAFSRPIAMACWLFGQQVLFGPALAPQRQFVVAEGQHAARQPDLHHMIVELGDLGPAFAHFAAKQCGVAGSGKRRISIVVEHDPVAAPQHHDRHA